jgi:hypothetical protein
LKTVERSSGNGWHRAEAPVLMRGAHIYPAIATAGGTKMEDEDENEDEDESTARRFLHSL